MGVNYKEILKKAESRKYNQIYDKIPFIRGKDKREQMWWIRFYRLRTVWQKHKTTMFPGDRFVDGIIFNSNRSDDCGGGGCRDANPWDAPNYRHGFLGRNHQVNFVLCEVEECFMDECIEWERLPLFDIEFPQVSGCFDKI